MVIEEFISTYAEKELVKIDALQGLSQDSQDIAGGGRDKFGTVRMRSPQGDRTNMRDVLVQGNPNSMLSGTHHQKRFTAAQISSLRKSGAAREI